MKVNFLRSRFLPKCCSLQVLQYVDMIFFNEIWANSLRKFECGLGIRLNLDLSIV